MAVSTCVEKIYWHRCASLVQHLVLNRYHKWKDLVVFSGPQGLRMIRGFGDEALRGHWRGHRSSRLNRQYRVIYRVVAQEIRVEVIDVTAHDCRRK